MISGKIKTVTIKRDSLGNIYIYLATDAVDFEIVERTGKIVGYDFGLKKFLTASGGVATTTDRTATRTLHYELRINKGLRHRPM